MHNSYTPTVLTIAGSDNYGGAGVQIDSKTIHALGGYAFSSITALTAQNSIGVKAVYPTPTEIFKQQLESILDDIEVDAVKIGMLGDAKMVNIVADSIEKYKLKNIVLDTVFVSSSGKRLLEESAVDIMVDRLFPIVDLITPNIPEVNALLGSTYAGKEGEMESIANSLFEFGVEATLIKGGHSCDKKNATDYLAQKLYDISSYSSARINTTHTHGTGCILSSAIATHLAIGYSLADSVNLSKAFLYREIQDSSILNFKYIIDKSNRKEPIL